MRTALSPQASRRDVVLTTATLRAGAQLGLKDVDIARVLGVSPSTLSRLRNQERTISPESKEGELALLLVRIFRSLDGILGEDREAMRAWFHETNRHLRGVPAELVRNTAGLVRVVEYLDAMRART